MRRAVLATIAVAGWWLLSCREIPAPEEGVLSISPVILPSPGLVVGDTMRDSLGLVAPLQVIAFDMEGNPVPGVQPTFVVLDTGAHVDGALLIGDDTVATGVAAIVAGLQTDTVRVPVTLEPQQIVAADSVRYLLTPGQFDSADSTDLPTRVVNNQGATVKGIQAIIVRYEIVQAPPSVGGTAGPSIVLVPGDASATRDTTDSSGNAARRARFRFTAIPPTITTDSAVINATASYRGQTLGTVQFTVVFTKQ